MDKKLKNLCQKCGKETLHEKRLIDEKEVSVCLKCEKLSHKKEMLDIIGYIDPRERYSLRADRALEEERTRIGRPF